ncbi:MAG: hypothetical protein AB8F95_17450 [Bacteroidia bacterium]
MNIDFEELAASRSDQELIQMLAAPEGEYQDEAVKAAKVEFDKRGISQETVEHVHREIVSKAAIAQEKAEKPLATGVKVLAFLFPIAPVFWAMGILTADGYERQSSELFRWALGGIGFYILLGIVLS